MRNLEMSNVEIATENRDQRPPFWLNSVEGADFFRVKVPKDQTPAFQLEQTTGFRVFGCPRIKDTTLDTADDNQV